jgi:hypothetical protein
VIGFSSMVLAERAGLEAVVSGVIPSTRYRFVVLSGWMDLTVAAAAADRVLTTAEAPLGVLLPHAAALIHTGGAAARIPGVTLPHLPDSYFWTRCLVEVGRAIEIGPASAVSVETVRAALGRCLALLRDAWAAEPNDGAERAAARLLAAAHADVPVGAAPTRGPGFPS